MNRRLFLQFPLLAPVLMAAAKANPVEIKKRGFRVAAGKDRSQSELNIMGGQFDCKVSAKDTDGAFLLYDTRRRQKGGPAYHLHHYQDEFFYVIKGEFIVKVGAETLTLKDGDFAFAPRKVPHAFAKVNDGEARMLVMFQPAGSMEAFFAEMSKLGKDIPKDQEHKLKALWAAHGMELIGPPPTV